MAPALLIKELLGLIRLHFQSRWHSSQGRKTVAIAWSLGHPPSSHHVENLLLDVPPVKWKLALKAKRTPDLCFGLPGFGFRI
jgi:hypothetical protein